MTPPANPLVNRRQIVLLVEDDPSERQAVIELLAAVDDHPFDLVAAVGFAAALQQLDASIAAVLLDLSLPDGDGLDMLAQLGTAAPQVPTIVLTEQGDRTLALQALEAGAQDYLVKGSIDGELLVRSLHYAIYRHCSERHLRQQVERERALARSIERIRRSLQVAEISLTTAREVQQCLNVARVEIAPCAPTETGSVVVAAAAGNAICWQRRNFCGQPAAASGDAVPPPEVGTTALVVPIWSVAAHDRPSQLWGWLSATSTERVWGRWEMDFLEHVAGQLAIALHQAQLYRQLARANARLKRLATRDDLTNLANRREFDRAHAREWQRLSRQCRPLSVLAVDIDHFKLFNDTYGHPEGDACLQSVARAIAGVVGRAGDLVARYGGEEFAVLLPNTDLKGALTVARRLHQYLNQRKIPHLSSPVCPHLTTSIGVASCYPPLGSPTELMAAADRALYRAKQDGRNRVVAAPMVERGVATAGSRGAELDADTA